jgi:hypothetical protein
MAASQGRLAVRPERDWSLSRSNDEKANEPGTFHSGSSDTAASQGRLAVRSATGPSVAAMMSGQTNLG